MYIMTHKGALQAVRICKIQYGLMRSKALDRSKKGLRKVGLGRAQLGLIALHFAAHEINSTPFGTDEAGVQ